MLGLSLTMELVEIYPHEAGQLRINAESQVLFISIWVIKGLLYIAGLSYSGLQKPGTFLSDAFNIF